MDPKKADAAAEAILYPHRKAQDERSLESVSRAAYAITARRAARWGVLGSMLGAVSGHLLAGQWLEGWVFGFGVGAVIGHLVLGRRV